MNEDSIILGAETAQREAKVYEQREHTKLKRAGYDPERVMVVPKDQTIRTNVPEPSGNEPIAFAPKGKTPDRASDGTFLPSAKTQFDAALAKASGRMEDQKAEGVEAGEPAAKTAEPTEAAEPKVEVSKALKDAKDALKLFAGYDEGDLEGLSEETVIKLGVKAHAKTVEIAKRLERDAKAAKEPTAPAKVEEAVVTIVPTEDPIAMAAKGFSEKYEGEFGQEIEDFGRKIVGPYAEKLAAAEKRLAETEARVEAVLFKDAVSALRERFPQVDQPENGTLLRSKMDDLALTGKYDNHLALAEDAALLVFGKSAIEAAKAEAKSEAKRSGQPLSAKRDATPRPRTAQEVHEARLKAAAAGASREEIRAIG